MKKKLSFLAILIAGLSFSQSYIGFLNDNYSGVHGVINNPSSIVDSRYRADINLIGFSGFISNDYAEVDIFKLIKDGKNFKFNENSNRFLTKDNNGSANIDFLGPSFMFNITPKHSVAFSTRLRTYINANEINGKTLELLKEDFDYEKNFQANLNNINATANSWAEIGVTYAGIILDKDQHFLKGGLTLKYLSGLGFAKSNGTNIKVDYNTGTDSSDILDNTLTTTGELSYSYTDAFKDSNEFDYEKAKEALGSGFGADFGFTYEWRPNASEYTYSNKEGAKLYYKDVNKYKLKLVLSATDIGSIKYNKSKNETYRIDNIFNKSNFDDLPNNTSEALKKLFGNPVNSSNSATVNLPTAIHFSADWNINQLFYLNLDTNFDVANEKDGNNIENTYSLTPRFEKKWFSAYVPLSIYEFSDFNAGLGIRLGPLYAGSGSILTNLINEKSKSTDFYFGLKIPLYQKRPKDKDQDGIFDKVDNCPKEAGPAENNGCPWGDKDEDGLTDNIDNCVDTAGPKENNGCPWGDKDEDGVTDNLDKCIDVAGLKEFNGCPDTDGDGIEDSKDKCPKIAGDKLYNGCPADSDGDGIIDSEDKCPKVAGVKSENGCPEKPKIIITKEAKKTIDSYAKSIYFNSAKTTFKPGVTGKLDMIVDVMNQFPEAKFSIEGHTDSQGKATLNQRLSERRAKAVVDYLISKGISSNRLKSYGFGEEYPIDTNKTRAGRANNRRVEIKLNK